ncbi:hypothetical protein EGI20_13130 [Aquitalea sp. S1-19]|nr:hypothetical protein [Aquitalea sp. S1-19]
MSKEKKHVIAYVGAAFEYGKDIGGYGVLLSYGSATKELSGGFRMSNKRRMELHAAIVALESIKESCRVTIHSDSAYLVETMALGRAQKWKEKKWLKSDNSPAANRDLLGKLIEQSVRHEVEWISSSTSSINELEHRISYIAISAMANPDLPTDDGCEAKKNTMPDGSKITQEGQACRKCGTSVTKQTPKRKPRSTQEYYYDYYLYCPSCKTMYMVEEAKVMMKNNLLI